MVNSHCGRLTSCNPQQLLSQQVGSRQRFYSASRPSWWRISMCHSSCLSLRCWSPRLSAPLLMWALSLRERPFATLAALRSERYELGVGGRPLRVQVWRQLGRSRCGCTIMGCPVERENKAVVGVRRFCGP